jgi:hypothetical protein
VPQTPSSPSRTLTVASTVASTAARLRLFGAIATAGVQPRQTDHARHRDIVPSSVSRALYSAREVPAGSPSNSPITRPSKYVIPLTGRRSAGHSRRDRHRLSADVLHRRGMVTADSEALKVCLLMLRKTPLLVRRLFAARKRRGNAPARIACFATPRSSRQTDA